MCALNVHIFHVNDTFTGNMNWYCGMPNTCHKDISSYKIMNNYVSAHLEPHQDNILL